MTPNRLTADLVRHDNGDINQMLALNTSEYGPDDILATREDFVWRRDKNPAGQAIIPVIRIRREAVVGFIWLVPLRIRAKGQNYLAAAGTNLVIQPEHRRTFAYVKLMRKFEQALRDNNIPLHFSFVSKENYKQLRARSPQTAFTVPTLVKPLDFRTLSQASSISKWKHFIGSQANWLVQPFFRKKPYLNRNEDITVSAIEEFDENFDEFWSRARDKYPVMAIRDRGFLTWRFASLSGRRYRIFVAQLRGKILGYTVVRCVTIRGFKTGLILDLLVVDHPLGMEAGGHLMAEAEAFFRTQEMPLTAGLMAPWATEYRILRQSGYRDLPSTIAFRPFHFAFFIHSKSQEALKCLSTGDWFITLADYESF